MIQTKQIDIPVFLQHCEVLYESGYMSKLTIRRLARNLQVQLDKQGDKANKQAQKAVREFSVWASERE